MSVALDRVQIGREIGRIDVGGRTLRLTEHRHRGTITSRALIAGHGRFTPRLEASAYRSGSERVFDVDPIVVRAEARLETAGERVALHVDRLSCETTTDPDVVRAIFDDAGLWAALRQALTVLPVVIIAPPDGPVAAVTDRTPAALELSDTRASTTLAALADALPEIRARALPSFLTRAPRFRFAIA